MLIGLVGPSLAGKKTVARWLVEMLQFEAIQLVSGEQEENTDWVSRHLTPAAALEHAAQHWSTNMVLFPITCPELLQTLRRKPHFVLVGVHAPLLTRFSRQQSPKVDSLEEFVVRSHASEERVHTHLCDALVDNSAPGLDTLRSHLPAVHARCQQIMRPDWDHYFMDLAQLTSRRSNCMKRRVGCVVVDDRRVVSTGYNGTPSHLPNCNAGGCHRCNSNTPRGQGLGECLCLHAEENALLEAGRRRAAGATLYTTTCPCLGCAKRIVQCGLARVVYLESYAQDEAAGQLLAQAGITLERL